MVIEILEKYLGINFKKAKISMDFPFYVEGGWTYVFNRDSNLDSRSEHAIKGNGLELFHSVSHEFIRAIDSLGVKLGYNWGHEPLYKLGDSSVVNIMSKRDREPNKEEYEQFFGDDYLEKYERGDKSYLEACDPFIQYFDIMRRGKEKEENRKRRGEDVVRFNDIHLWFKKGVLEISVFDPDQAKLDKTTSELDGLVKKIRTDKEAELGNTLL